MSNFVQKALVAVFMPASMVLGGCATTNAHQPAPPVVVSAEVLEAQEAKSMAVVLVQTDDPSLRAAGLATMRQANKILDSAAGNVANAAVDATLDCKISSIKIVDGRKVVKMTDCMKPATPAAP